MKQIVFALTIIVLSINPAAAESTNSIGVKVKGMVCDFCARGLEKTFGKKDAVKSVGVDLDSGMLSINLKEGKSLSDGDIKKLVTDNGVTVVEIKRRQDAKSKK